jgi:hypothetical protein
VLSSIELLNLGCLHPVARVISYDMGLRSCVDGLKPISYDIHRVSYLVTNYLRSSERTVIVHDELGEVLTVFAWSS